MDMLKSYDILMGNFYRADQGEEETVTSFATRIEGLLSQVRDKFPNQIPLSKEQELLKDRLYHGCQKTVRDSMKYHHGDTSVDYMTFLEECRKTEDEDRAGKSKIKGKLKVAATTISSTQSEALAKQLKRQQQQFETLMGKMQSMVATLQSQNAQASTTFRQENPSLGMRGRRMTTYNDRREGPGGRGLPPQSRWRGQPQLQRPPSQPSLMHPQQEQGTAKTYTDNQCWQHGEVRHLERSCPMLAILKGKALFQGGNA